MARYLFVTRTAKTGKAEKNKFEPLPEIARCSPLATGMWLGIHVVPSHFYLGVDGCGFKTNRRTVYLDFS